MEATSYVYAQWLWLKILGIAYLVAFASLLPQIKGLYGSQGICPIRDLLSSLRTHKGKKPYFRCPTLFWFNSSDRTLTVVATLGVVAAILFLMGISPVLMLVLLWIGYISFCTVGSEFLSYQWDALLLEVGFIGIFFALQTPPSPSMILFLYFFAFRFAFSSGIVKWLSQDPTWRHYKALDYHYYTQPIPGPLSWYAHWQPQWVSRATCFAALFIEIILPFFIPISEGVRVGIFGAWLLLQVAITVTGNYTFFTGITMGILVILIPDSYWQPILGSIVTPELSPGGMVVSMIGIIAAVIFTLTNATQLIGLFYRPGVLYKLLRRLAPYYITNRYGLFAVMTTSRREIEIEGSYDGLEWRRYEFKYKPSDPFKRPPQVAPHQPRLDWQMWFAALNSYEANMTRTSWFGNFMLRLLQGSRSVDGLLRHNPFKARPPKLLRATIYEYTFTTKAERETTKRWWNRTFIGEYGPVMQLKPLREDED